MGRSRYKFKDNTAPHFMTCTVLKWISVFIRPETVNIVLDSFRYLTNEGFQLYAFVILENHLHLIAQSKQLDRDMMRTKVEYIHNNPVVRGYVDRPEHWRYSSARNYIGEQGLLDVCMKW
jgi:REP element-mobilizing transposase RayT